MSVSNMPRRNSRWAVRALGLLTMVLVTRASGDSISLEQAGTLVDPHGNLMMVFKLTNTSAAAVSYSGYAPALPNYTTQFRRLGQWRDAPGAWCGFGLKDIQLPAHQVVTFTVPPWEGKTSRICLDIAPARAGGKPESQQIRSAPVTISLEAIHRNAGDASSLVRTEVTHHPEHKSPYTLTLANTSSQTLYYGGFHDPNVPPIYLNQERVLGHWKDDGEANWAEKGVAFHPLPSHRSISFSIPAQSLDKTWRIGIRLYRTDHPKTMEDTYLPVWWPPLPPRNKS